jgi:hypothetical protein
MEELWKEFQTDKAQKYFFDPHSDCIWNVTERAKKELVCILQYQAFIWLYNKYVLNNFEYKREFKQHQTTQFSKEDNWNSTPSELRNITIKYQKQAFVWLHRRHNETSNKGSNQPLK